MAPAEPDSRTHSKFEAFIEDLTALEYRSRRNYLWRHQRMPRLSRFLYKFRSLEPSKEASVARARDLIVRSQFWLSSPLDFNDPFDMSAKLELGGTIDQQKKRIDAILTKQGFKFYEREKQLPDILSRPDKILAEVRHTYEQTVEQTGIYSFGGDPRSILMWSHYAANHEGLCFQFEIARDPETFIKRVLTIKYSEDYPVINWTTERESGMQAIIERKHIGWEYELERRLVVPEHKHRYFPFRPEALTAIIIGCRAKDVTVAKLCELIVERSSSGHPTPKLYRSVKHESKYKLLIEAFHAKSVHEVPNPS